MKRKQQIAILKEKNDKLKMINTILIILIIGVDLIFGCMDIYNKSIYDNNTNQLKEQLKTLSESSSSNDIAKEDTIAKLRDTVYSLNNELSSLSEINKSYVDELNTLRNRAELYDKYDYAIIDESGNRTDLTYEEIQYGEDLMKEKGYDPNLLFGTIMVESRGNSQAVNSDTGATGYGQIMTSTGQYLWNDVLGNDTPYSDEIAKNGKSNIQLMTTLYDTLFKQGYDTFQVVKNYSGNSTDSGTASYLQRINNYTNTKGVVIN